MLITLRYSIECMSLSYKILAYIQNVPHAAYRNIHRYPRKGKNLLIFHPWPAIYGIEQVNEKYLHEHRKRDM